MRISDWSSDVCSSDLPILSRAGTTFFQGSRMNDDQKEPQGNPWMKSLFIWAGILLALVLFVQIVDGGGPAASGEGMAYSEFLNRVDEGSVKQVVIQKDVISGARWEEHTFELQPLMRN